MKEEISVHRFPLFNQFFNEDALDATMTSLDTTLHPILYTKPVCWEHLHPRQRNPPCHELSLLLDPVLLSVLDAPLVKVDAPCLDASTVHHDGRVVAPPSSSLVQGESLHSPLLDQLVDHGTLKPGTFLRSCVSSLVLHSGTSDVTMDTHIQEW